MSEGANDSGLFATAREAVGRRRIAPRAESTSDVRRFFGIGIASVVAAIVVLVVAVLTVDPVTVRSPGPLASPHAEAGLSCASCHEPPRPAATACVGCHGAHPSTRPGHRALAERGVLRCVDCHAVHDDLGGVELRPGEAPVRFGPGAAQPVPELPAAEVSERVVVPLVPVAHCGRCHRPDRPDDPAARCVLADQADLGGQRPSVCFDEHVAYSGEAFARAEGLYERTRAWAVAREVAAAAPVPPAPERNEHPPWWWLGFGVLAAALSYGAVKLGARLWQWRAAAAGRAAVSVQPPTIRRLPLIDTTTCIGCHACVDACPYDVLEVRSFVAQVVRPDDCCGLTLCEQRCPNGSLVIADGDAIADRPRVDDALESIDTRGLYLAGDLTGLPLIRNAINQGATAARAAAASLRAEGSGAAWGDDELDLVIVGSGPAGLSASLAAAEAKLRYVTLEQGSVAHSVRSFPRGKLVFDQPLGLPLEGDLWLRESTKEELLGQWRRIIAARGLAIEEHTTVTAVRRLSGGSGGGRPLFGVEATTESGPRSWRARRVILALGRRGTPRRLATPIPDALASRVHYSLADARSFAGQRVLVVGLGDVAMEAAIGLAGQPGTEVTLSYRGDDFRRGKGRNIEQVRRLVKAERIELRFGTEVERVEAEAITLRGEDGEVAVGWDAMFVMIGSRAPWPFLEAAGIMRGAVEPSDAAT